MTATLSMMQAIRRALRALPAEPSGVPSLHIVLTPMGRSLVETEIRAIDLADYASTVYDLSSLAGLRRYVELPAPPLPPPSSIGTIFGHPVTVEAGEGVGYVEAVTDGGQAMRTAIELEVWEND